MKCLYMALIVDAHHTAFDETKRAIRWLSELRNTMSVVWENSSDCIAIYVQKVSGSTTSMVSPSFFRSALVARKGERIQDMSAIVLEHSSPAMQTAQLRIGSFDNVSQIKDGIRIVKKDAFAGIDILSSCDNGSAFECLGQENEVMTSLVAGRSIY